MQREETDAFLQAVSDSFPAGILLSFRILDPAIAGVRSVVRVVWSSDPAGKRQSCACGRNPLFPAGASVLRFAVYSGLPSGDAFVMGGTAWCDRLRVLDPADLPADAAEREAEYEVYRGAVYFDHRGHEFSGISSDWSGSAAFVSLRLVWITVFLLLGSPDRLPGVSQWTGYLDHGNLSYCTVVDNCGVYFDTINALI